MVRGGLDTSISAPLYQATRWSQCEPMTHPDHTATGSTAHHPEATEATEPVRPAGGGSLRPVAVLAVGSFAMGTDSFVLAGILPNIAGGLHVSTAAAGQTITVFALTYVSSSTVSGTLSPNYLAPLQRGRGGLRAPAEARSRQRWTEICSLTGARSAK